MSSSPDTPVSPSNTPPPSGYGLNARDVCDIPLVEILKIDSDLSVDTPRSEAPSSDQDITEALVMSPASSNPDSETKA